MIREIELRAPNWQNEEIATIYFGGGTPSLLTPNEIEILLEAVYKLGTLIPNAEITLECNPDDCTLDNLKAWKKLGINRLSMGVQSFNPQQLAWMNRTHNAEEALTSIQRAYQTGFEVLTCDIIYGLPGMNIAELKQQVKTLVDLGVNHLSAYCLTVEPKTALAKLVSKRDIQVATTDEQAEQFLFLIDYLERYGFEQYEISNFARNNAYSKHNTAYWQGRKYLGIGPSAHGFNGTERYWNISNNTRYMKSLESDELQEEKEVLSINDRFNEAILIGLRTQWGVSKSLLNQIAMPLTADWMLIWNAFEQEGLGFQTADAFILTKQGRLQADYIASELFILSN